MLVALGKAAKWRPTKTLPRLVRGAVKMLVLGVLHRWMSRPDTLLLTRLQSCLKIEADKDCWTVQPPYQESAECTGLRIQW